MPAQQLQRLVVRRTSSGGGTRSVPAVRQERRARRRAAATSRGEAARGAATGPDPAWASARAARSPRRSARSPARCRVRRFMCVRYWLALTAKTKSGGVSSTHARDRLRLGEPVEGGVDLDGVEQRRVVLEPAPRGQALRVHALAPVGVVPARAADADRRPCRQNARRWPGYSSRARSRSRRSTACVPRTRSTSGRATCRRRPTSCAPARAQADGLLTLITDRVDAELLDAAPQLRAIANMAVGTDNIDLEAAADARRSRSATRPDVLTDATADIAFALLLALARRICRGRRRGARRASGRRGSRPATSAPTSPARRSGSSAGAGSARPSRAAPRASAWRSCTARARRAFRSTSCSSGADFVSLHTPLTAETRAPDRCCCSCSA